jgi:hypothetical protein
MGLPGGGRNPVTNRFVRHFNFISFSDIDDENVTLIFGTIMTKFFNTSGFNEDTKSRLPALMAASPEVYNTISKELRPRPSRPHYLFNLATWRRSSPASSTPRRGSSRRPTSSSACGRTMRQGVASTVADDHRGCL